MVAEVALIGTVVAEVALTGTVIFSNVQLEALPALVTFGTEIAVPKVTFEAVVVDA